MMKFCKRNIQIFLILLVSMTALAAESTREALDISPGRDGSIFLLATEEGTRYLQPRIVINDVDYQLSSRDVNFLHRMCSQVRGVLSFETEECSVTEKVVSLNSKLEWTILLDVKFSGEENRCVTMYTCMPK